MVAIYASAREGVGFGLDPMSALGQKRTYAAQQPMSALPPKADMCSALAYVRFGPKADIAETKKKDRLAAVFRNGVYF